MASSEAGPSRRRPFVASEHRPAQPDGIFRVVLITTGSVASVKAPDIAGALAKNPRIHLEIVATEASLHFFDQQKVDQAIEQSRAEARTKRKKNSGNLLGPIDWESVGNPGIWEDTNARGVHVWTDKDEWSDWKAVGDPILHIELRRWADLVVVAPCSADMLAKIAGGLSENLALSLLRALTPDTPVILCPAMNTHMYQHKITAKHLRVVQEELEYMVLGPQGTGTLACGDEGAGKMTDWREIVGTIETMAQEYLRKVPPPSNGAEQAAVPASDVSQSTAGVKRARTPPTPGRDGLVPPKANSYESVLERNGSSAIWEKKWWMG